ncbi:MAG: hypothetical protein HFH60_03600 [Lachnospiraceae bacterium]|nr:hypothetical protein [Lachnospiraceae bacterium]
MIIGNDENTTSQIKIPIDNYADKLVRHMTDYLDRVEYKMQAISKNDDEKAKVFLRWTLFPNKKEIESDYRKIENNLERSTWNTILNYTRCIMQLVGELAECVIVDHCSTDTDINRICINIAKFMLNIYGDYKDIKYDEYIAFSTSFKYLIYKDMRTGIYLKRESPDYNPKHTSKDIAWCKKKNLLSQLKVNLPQLGYLENAKLQIKATLNCSNLDLKKYLLTPVLCFDFNNDFYKLKMKYPNHIIYSVRQLFPDMYVEMEYYFKIIAAYATGLIDHINITEIEVHDDWRLTELFRTPVMDLVKENPLNVARVIEMAKQYNKPIIIGT